MRRLRSDAGLSLVEATIILMTLAILTAAVAPTAGGYLEGARQARAREDVEAIGGAIDELLRNTGLLCVSKSPASATPCTIVNRVELLVSGSSITANEATVATSAFAAPASTASAANLNWAGHSNEVGDAWKDLMDNHLVTNSVTYTSPSFTGGGGPRVGVGWRGPYLSGPIDVDPWGNSYQAGTLFLAVASDAAAGSTAGQRQGGWTSDVVVISAGSNGVVQTAFGATATSAVGDDVIFVLQGGTH